MTAEHPPSTPLRYDFTAPSRIVFGWGRRSEAGALARSLGRRAFVVCGSRTLKSSGALDALKQSLTEAGVEFVRLDAISREPLVDDVDRCVALLREAGAGTNDLVLAIGGGSAIDLGKAAAALAAQDATASVRENLEGVGSGLQIVNTPLPVLAMPTTGGTGSEVTRNAVISSYDPPFKKSLRSELMVPRIVLVDPELSCGVSQQVTAWTGMDAITQLLESLVSRKKTAVTNAMAMRGLKLALAPGWAIGAVGNDVSSVPVVEAFRDGRSQTARERMAEAALLSGLALANSGLGMAHGVAAALGVHCQVPHGLACAVMLPATLKTNVIAPSVESELRPVGGLLLGARNTTFQLPRSSDGLSASVLELVDAILRELKIPRRLSEIGVRREQIPAIVRDSRGNSMNGNPRELSDEELTRILEDML